MAKGPDNRPAPSAFCLKSIALRYRLSFLTGPRVLVFPLKLVNASGGVHQLLAPGEERVAGGADLHTDIALMRGTRLEGVTAGANHFDRVVCGMNSGLHFVTGIPFESFSIPKIRTPANSQERAGER